MKIIFTILFLCLSLTGFGQASTQSNFNLTIKFDKSINIDSINVFFFETLGQSFKSINYSTNKSNNSMKVFGNNHYIIGTKFPTLVFSYKTFETKEYFCADTLNKNIRFPCKEIVENTQLFYLIAGHHLGSYNDTIPTEIIFTLEKNNIMITKEWTNPVENGRSEAKYTVHTAAKDELTHGYIFKQELSISNKLTKINKI